MAATFIAKTLDAGAAQDGAAVAIATRWAQHSPRDAAQWVSQFPDSPSRNTAERDLMTLWTTQDAPGAANWLNELPTGTLRNVGLIAYAQAVTQQGQTRPDE